VLDAELVETGFPLLELASVGTAEADMVQSGTELVEQLARVGRAVRVQRQEDAAWRREDDVVESPVMTVERGNRLVEDGFGAQQALVPLAFPVTTGWIRVPDGRRSPPAGRRRSAPA
jgi:hypothetical protein